MTALACPTQTQCIATTHSGAVLTSTDPTAAAATWTAHPIDTDTGNCQPNGCTAHLTGVNCPTAALCVATDDLGDVLTSANAWAAAPAWSNLKHLNSTRDPESYSLLQDPTSVACASAALCITVDSGGNVIASTDPGAAAPHWTKPQPAAPSDGSTVLPSACAANGICVTASSSGDATVGSSITSGAAGVASDRRPRPAARVKPFALGRRLKG